MDDRAPFTVRPAAAGEMNKVAALFREYAAELEPVDLSYQNFEAELAGLPGRYAAPDGILLFAEAPDREMLGCVAVRPLAEPGTCEMKRLHVRQSARGLGLGRALALAAIEAAGHAGHARMRLDTLPTMQAAIALYESLGFTRIEAYYATPITGTIFMEKVLARPMAANPEG